MHVVQKTRYKDHVRRALALLHLAAADQQAGVYLGGNIGTPCLDILREDASLYVLEVSSYQLELAQDLRDGCHT